jgi:Rrf2 family protein
MALHVLLHMAEFGGRPVTSEDLGAQMGVNPVFIRQTMAGLRDAGLLISVKGHGGGWSIAKSLKEISLLDVYKALGEPVLIQQHRKPLSSSCAIEHVVGRSLNQAFQEAEELIMRRFSKIRLDDLSSEFHLLHERHKHGQKKGAHA